MDPADFRADETGSLFKPSSASSSIPIFVSVVRANAQHVLIAFTTQKLQAKIDIYERKTRKLVRTFARDCLRVITSEFVRDSNMVVSLTNEGTCSVLISSKTDGERRFGRGRSSLARAWDLFLCTGSRARTI